MITIIFPEWFAIIVLVLLAIYITFQWLEVYGEWKLKKYKKELKKTLDILEKELEEAEEKDNE